MSERAPAVHWSVKFWIGLLIVMTMAQSYLLNRNAELDAANVCLTMEMILSEYGPQQFTADQDYMEWRQSRADALVECVEGLE